MFYFKDIRFLLLLTLAAIGASTLAALAYDAPCTHPACEAAEAEDRACRIYINAADGHARLHSSALQGDILGISRDQPDGCYQPGRVYALQGWRINTRGGHKVRRITVLQDSDAFELGLEDGDGGDDMDGFVWLVPLPQGTELQTVGARECRGGCKLRMPAIGADETVVLAGFQVTRADGDGHVKRLVVGPVLGTPANPEMRVNFSDSDFPYSVTVQYAVLPNSAVERAAKTGKSYVADKRWSGSATEIPAGYEHPDLRHSAQVENKVLRGFALAFRDGGKFLEDVGIEPERNNYEAWFQDNQATPQQRRLPDDPFDWRVDFVGIR